MKRINKIIDVAIIVLVLAGIIRLAIFAYNQAQGREEMAEIAAKYKIELERALKISQSFEALALLQGKINDSLLIQIDKRDIMLQKLKIKHKQEMDELKKIPPDTVYKLLQVLYPNVDDLPQKYPFSSSQIVPIYTTAEYSKRLQIEYDVLGVSYNDCRVLVAGLYKENGLLDSTNINLKRAVVISGNQIQAMAEQNTLLRSDNKKLKTWTKIAAISGTIFAIIAVAK